MDTQDFLRRVLGYEGYYCVFAAKDGSRKQKFYSSIDQLLGAAQQFDANGFDTYFALATFGLNSDGKPDRKAETAQQMRAFFMDLDCGENKPFATQAVALSALKQFVKWNSLPVPTLVNSGRGVHVYWALTEPQEPSTWRAAAERLKALCREQEFHADPAITADVARVLRVPGTHNYKDEPPKPVALLGPLREPVSFDDFVAKLPEVSSVFGDAAPSLAELAKNDPLLQRLMGNRVSNFGKIMKRTLKGEGCEQLKYAATHQSTIDEPMWRAALSIAWHCEDRDKAIHLISNRHPQYDADETQAKAAGTKGPYLCDKFDEYNPGICDKCPLRGKIKSPISIGGYVPEGGPLMVANGVEVVHEGEDGDLDGHVNGHTQTIYSQINYPGNYYRPAGRPGVYLKVKGEPDENGNATEKEVVIYHNDLYVVRRVMDPESGENLVWRVHLPKDGSREFTVPLASVTSREEFRKALSAEGVPAYGKDLDNIMAYGKTWVTHLQEEGEADIAHRQFGWTDYDKLDMFVLGSKLIQRSAVEYNPPSTTTAGFTSAFQQGGTLQEWKDMMAFYNRPGMEIHQFIIGCCAGAPLMALTPIHGAVLALLSSGSGYGKTTTSLAGLSIWGNPDELISHQEDTMNSRLNRSELFCNLPMVMDEITSIEPQDASKLAYQVANGKQRNRMQSGGNRERWRGRPWHTVFITTSNSSLFDKLAALKLGADGESRRIMEYTMDKVIFGSKRETDEFAVRIMRNYGHVGVPLVQSYMQDMEKTKEGLYLLQESVDVKCGLQPEDRFYSAITASALVGLQHLHKLGLVTYDLKALKRWVTDVFIPKCMNNLKESELTIEKILNEYLNVDNYGSVLRIKSNEDLRASGNAGIDQLATQVPDKQPGHRFIARYETDKEMLYLVPSPFKKWCAQRQVSYQSVVALMQERYDAKIRKVRLNKGTRFSMPPTDAWEINLNLETITGQHGR